MNKKIAAKLGYWSSMALLILGCVYFVVVIIYVFTTKDFKSAPTPFVQLTSGIITFLTVPVLVMQFSAIRFIHDGDNKIFGSLGVSFILLFAATVSINRFVQITVIQQNLPDLPSDLMRFTPYGSGSVMFALEILGWGFFSSIAAVFVAPLFSSSRLNIAIRWLFFLYAFLSFNSFISYVTNITIPTGPIAWGPVIVVLSILLLKYFRKIYKQEI
jgi:hypothetical protein